MIKNKKILIIMGIITVLLITAVIIIFTKDTTPEINIPQIDKEDILNIDVPKVTDTPIDNVEIEEDIKTEPIIDTDREPIVKKDEIEQEVIPRDGEVPLVFDMDRLWDEIRIETSNYLSLFDYTWSNQIYRHPVNHGKTMIRLNLPVMFKDDANEKKEKVLYIVDSFMKNFPDVIYKEYDELKNINDIPDEGIYILSQNEDSFCSLRIYPPLTEKDKFFNIYITFTDRIMQLCNGIDTWQNIEIKSLQKVLTSLNRQEELDIIRRVGLEYFHEYEGASFSAEDENLTPEQKALLLSMGVKPK